ncbi:MAG TPA: hypothetical protein VN737_02510 [Bryobacteraceae bacterium]|nr:hypothetical protein [Bryobacteraceae bacterium]
MNIKEISLISFGEVVVQFHFLRATKSAASLAALAVALAGPAAISGYAQEAPASQQPAAGQQAAGQQKAGQPNWKDRAEYDLYNQIAHETDLKKRLDLLDQWTQKYPKTEFEALRSQVYVATLGPLSQQDPNDYRQKAIDTSKKALQEKPNDFQALYWLAIDIPAAGGASPSPDQISDAQTAGNGLLQQADATFEASKKPASTSQADWDKAKNDVIALAHYALAWAANAKKDYPTAQKEFEAYLKANPNNANVSYQLGQILVAEQKPDLYPQALWSFARAASYDGPQAIAPDKKPAVLAYFQKVYKQYHGSDEGADQLLAQAKTSALPPPDFKIVSAQDLANQQAQQLTQKLQSDPALALWYSIKQNLTGDQGDSFFTNSVKDAEIPGGANGVKTFTGTVTSVDPPDHPTKVVVAVLDPTKPDATLVFSNPIPADAAKVGQQVQFSGVGDSFNKDPYMLTFKDPEIPGVKAAHPATHHKVMKSRPRR